MLNFFHHGKRVYGDATPAGIGLKNDDEIYAIVNYRGD